MPRDEVLDELAVLEARSRQMLVLEEHDQADDWRKLALLLDVENGSGQEFGLRTADHVVSVFSGLAGGMLDLRPGITKALTSEEMHARLDKAYKDRVREITGRRGTVAIDNVIGGRWHRMVGPTHDVFRLFRTIELVKNGQFESAVKGHKILRESYRNGLPPYLKVDSTSEALVLVLMHWAADFFSHESLPIPGWTKLAEIDDREFVMWLFKTYREGSDLRVLVSQFLSNMSGMTLVAILLRVYRYIDLFWITEKVEFSAGVLRLSDDLRFRWMSRNAALTAFTVSSGSAAISQDVFKLNYLALMKFFADARAVERLLDVSNKELDQQTDWIAAELGAY
jgi:hypothetical protein